MPSYIINIYIPGTKMTRLFLLEKFLVLEGGNPKIEEKQVPGIYRPLAKWKPQFGIGPCKVGTVMKYYEIRIVGALGEPS